MFLNNGRYFFGCTFAKLPVHTRERRKWPIIRDEVEFCTARHESDVAPSANEKALCGTSNPSLFDPYDKRRASLEACCSRVLLADRCSSGRAYYMALCGSCCRPLARQQPHPFQHPKCDVHLPLIEGVQGNKSKQFAHSGHEQKGQRFFIIILITLGPLSVSVIRTL